MTLETLLYLSKKGGSISCFKGDTGRLFRVCSSCRCLYVSDLHSAKAQLDLMEENSGGYLLGASDIPAQRKTTLKWNSNGDLSAIDMARILDRLSNPALRECELSCVVEDT